MSAWPQYAVLLLLFTRLVSLLVKDGNEPNVEKRAVAILASFSTIAIFAWLLHAGGFWAPLGFSP